MELKTVKTRLVKEKGDLCKFVVESLRNAKKQFGKHSFAEVFNGSVVVISAKIVSLLEGNLVDLHTISFEDLVKREADEIISDVNGCFLTRKNGILIPNAGVDRSNVPDGYAIPWPKEPQKAADMVRLELLREFKIESFGVVVTDSRVTPGRRGTTGVALAWSGFVGVVDERGEDDLFGSQLKLTQRAIADNLASSALCVMGEAAECTPIVLIGNAPVTFLDGVSIKNEAIIDKKDDLFGF